MNKFRLLFLMMLWVLPCGIFAAYGQSVTGTVTDTTGEPVIGATVIVEKSSVGTSTDIDGNFSLAVKQLPATIKVSSIGYVAKSVKVDSYTHVNIVLEDNSAALDEVVVIGYGVVRKADLAGSVSVMDSKSFQAQPVLAVGDAIQGRVSGVNVIPSGIPGGSPKIRIRGSNSINKSNEPLYVVDGMVRESGLEGLNPEDVASMQILKDASSTAIYGSRGANGVVIITTKTGHKGESHITFDASFGFSQATHLPKLMSASDYARTLLEYFPGSSTGHETELQEYIDGTKEGIDWNDEVYRTGMSQNYKLVFTKGNEGMQTYISAGYMKDKGVIESSDYERFSFRANIKADLTKWLNVSADVDLSHGNGHGLGGVSMGIGPIYGAYTYSPTIDLRNERGEYNTDPYNSSMANPPMSQIHVDNERRMDIVNGRIDLRFNICKGLTFTTSNGLDYKNSYSYSMGNSKQYPGATTSMANSNSNRWLLQTTNNFTYIGDWDKHALTATAVWEATSATTRNMGIGGTNLLTESVGWWNVALAENKTASNGYSKWTLMSAVARAIYSYDNRYMATVTFRADGSSRLQNNKWAYFPSVALAWTISNEKFMQSITPIMSSLKLRASYGVIGNQDISPYETLTLMQLTNTYYGNTTPTPGAWTNKMPTPDLKWEKTHQVDVGIDAQFLNGRFDLSLDWYYKRTTDALLNTTPPAYLSPSAYYVNAGEVSNTGIDLSINATIIQGRDWNWTTGIQGSWMKNRVEKMTALEPALYYTGASNIMDRPLIVKEGEPIGSFAGFRWAGIDQRKTITQADGTVVDNPTYGYDTYYKKDGSITATPVEEDRAILGNSNPDFTLGWNNTITWKNWSLNVFFNGSFGAQRLNVLRYAMESPMGNSKAVTAEGWLDTVGKTNADPRLAGNLCYGASDKWIEDADYFRLENIALTYDLPKKVAKFADLRFTFSVQNAFTITGYKGVNPASLSFGGVEWQKGLDFGSTPAPRTYTLGVRFNF